MKTTTIIISAMPQNATINFADYGLSKINGQYKKNLRTGKVESEGKVPASINSRDRQIVRMMKWANFDNFTYSWNDIDGMINVSASGDSENCNWGISVIMQDDASPFDIKNAIIKAMDEVDSGQDRVSIDLKTQNYSISIYGDKEGIDRF